MPLTATRDHIKSTISLAMAIHKGTLIDFETTGRPRIDEECEIVTLGYLEGNNVVVTQRKGKDKEDFYRELEQLVRSLPRPLYSYNSSFERDIISEELRIETKEDEFVDIMKPWKHKAQSGGLKWPKLDELISEPEDYFQEEKISGKDVPDIWQRYLKTGDEKHLRTIMEHCLSDILREAILLIRYQA